MELRAGYKRTEVGVIPEDWEVRSLGSLAAISSGGTPRRDRPGYWNGTVPWVTTSQVDLGVITEVQEFITQEGLRHSAAKLMPQGTLVLALYGQGKTRGKVAVLGIEAATNQACATISIPSPVLRGFAYHNLSRRYHEIRSLSNSGSQENLSGAIIRSILLAIPSESEQRAIAEALGDVDALIRSLDQLIAKKRDLKQAAMQQLLTGRQRLPGFAGVWRTLTFSQVATRLNLKAFQVTASEYSPFGLVPIVDQGSTPIAGFTDRMEKCFRPPEGGVVVFGDHTCITKFVDFDFAVGAEGVQVIAAREHHRTRFLAYLLEEKPVPSTGYNRHFKFLLEMQFGMPPLDEQRAIAEVLSDLDAELTALEARRDKTHALKQGMMQALLTGRIRLV